jgi:DNA gyrase subunit B
MLPLALTENHVATSQSSPIGGDKKIDVEKKEKNKDTTEAPEITAEVTTVEEEEENTDASPVKGISIQRYKGLGEMNPQQLWETTMNPANRILKQVKLEDEDEADKLFNVLMGDEVLPRKKFIQAYAKNVQNLDI